jgi:hypothetical protein
VPTATKQRKVQEFLWEAFVLTQPLCGSSNVHKLLWNFCFLQQGIRFDDSIKSNTALTRIAGKPRDHLLVYVNQKGDIWFPGVHFPLDPATKAHNAHARRFHQQISRIDQSRFNGEPKTTIIRDGPGTINRVSIERGFKKEVYTPEDISFLLSQAAHPLGCAITSGT